ncbi:MAG TPA: hypothetical protein VIK60_12160, partial [Vicinamibacterales bacterium]
MDADQLKATQTPLKQRYRDEPTAFDEFLKTFPEYERTCHLDALRASEYRRLDAQRHVYLDYTGGALHAESQIREHAALLNDRVLGNPHSVSPTSAGMTDLVESARRA